MTCQCHAHPKAKDGAKRRRENSNVRMPPAPLVKSSRLDHQPSYQSYYQPHPPHTPQQYPHSHPHSQQTPQLQSPYNPGGILPPASMGQAPPPPPMYRNSNPLPGQVQMPPALFSNDMYPNMI